MDKTFNISVRDRLAKNLSHLDYVCGNTGYMVRFDFDEEWDAYPIKTARFIESSGEHHDVAVIDDQCEFPQIMNTIRVEVGVYAGDLYTTTPAVIGARRSILSTGGDRPAVPEENEYDKMMEAINADAARAENAAEAAEGFAEEAKEAAQNASGADIEIIHIDLVNGVYQSSHTYEEIMMLLYEKKTIIARSGMESYLPFGGESNALVFANVDYSGKQSSKSLSVKRLIIHSDNTIEEYYYNNIKVPNPFKLKLTGAVSAEYDGSEAVTVEFPSGGGSADQVQADWNENDPTSKAYVQNRTHYTETEQAIVLPQTTPVPLGDGQFAIMEPVVNQPTAGNVYTIHASAGENYELEAFEVDMEGLAAVGMGNPSFVGGENNTLPFLIVFFPADIAESMEGVSASILTLGLESFPAFSINGTVEKVYKIDKKYLPTIGAGWLANGSTIGSVRNINASHPEDESYKMGQNAFALGGYARGMESFAVGSDGADAEGDGSFAHCGHAAGHTSFAANGAFAEGHISFAANAGHAAGVNSAAFGQSKALGTRSFAEGLSTVAAGGNQHVQGKYNVEDTANKYAHIVGNGTSSVARRNAHTLDWDGNGWFAGYLESQYLILASPNGTRWAVKVTDAGVLTVEALNAEEENVVALSDDGEGNVTITGATLSDNGEGNVTIE